MQQRVLRELPLTRAQRIPVDQGGAGLPIAIQSYPIDGAAPRQANQERQQVHGPAYRPSAARTLLGAARQECLDMYGCFCPVSEDEAAHWAIGCQPSGDRSNLTFGRTAMSGRGELR